MYSLIRRLTVLSQSLNVKGNWRNTGRGGTYVGKLLARVLNSPKLTFYNIAPLPKTGVDFPCLFSCDGFEFLSVLTKTCHVVSHVERETGTLLMLIYVAIL